MIYITGDTHGQSSRFKWYFDIDADSEINQADSFIVCGDFGYLFRDDFVDNAFLDLLEQESKCNILFIDGNHENFKALYSYPVEEWNGGKVHRIRKNIFHLMRGQVFIIDGLRVFTMGGAYSIDRYMRKKDVSFWEEEIPNDDEYKEAVLNLYKNNKEVDIIITHTAPREIIRQMNYFPDRHDEELTGFLEWVMHEVDFKRWYFGHWHHDMEVNGKCRALYFDCVKIGLNSEGKAEEKLCDKLI